MHKPGSVLLDVTKITTTDPDRNCETVIKTQTLKYTRTTSRNYY